MSVSCNNSPPTVCVDFCFAWFSFSCPLWWLSCFQHHVCIVRVGMFLMLTSKDEINYLSARLLYSLFFVFCFFLLQMYIWYSRSQIKVRLNHDCRGCDHMKSITSTNDICTLSRFDALGYSSVLKRRSKSIHCRAFHHQKDFKRKSLLVFKLLLLSDWWQLFLLSSLLEICNRIAAHNSQQNHVKLSVSLCSRGIIRTSNRLERQWPSILYSQLRQIAAKNIV